MQQTHVFWKLLLTALVWLLALQGAAAATPVLNITPITWDIIGLDSNDVSVGPDTFPVGARVCNVGSTTATAVSAQFNFNSANSLINTIGLTQVKLDDLPPGPPPAHFNTLSRVPDNCRDAYFNVVVVRSVAAYNTTRRYQITSSASGVSSISTPANRQLYVEKLVSQARNYVKALQPCHPQHPV
ncbi:hypothetical protein ACFSC4_14580 [Deinococcus malanensis]|uniref:hypothetical protein n=1 Tax=Deinococcus malanensis TaxID=1706855 RepID=UPI0036431B35